MLSESQLFESEDDGHEHEVKNNKDIRKVVINFIMIFAFISPPEIDKAASFCWRYGFQVGIIINLKKGYVKALSFSLP